MVSVPDLPRHDPARLGLDHETLIYRHSGRDETLTDAPLTQVVDEIVSA